VATIGRRSKTAWPTWAKVKGLNFTDTVPDQEIDEIIEILCEEQVFRNIADQEREEVEDLLAEHSRRFI
jgi:hypothetical protein